MVNYHTTYSIAKANNLGLSLISSLLSYHKSNSSLCLSVLPLKYTPNPSASPTSTNILCSMSTAPLQTTPLPHPVWLFSLSPFTSCLWIQPHHNFQREFKKCRPKHILFCLIIFRGFSYTENKPYLARRSYMTHEVFSLTSFFCQHLFLKHSIYCLGLYTCYFLFWNVLFQFFAQLVPYI